jgi:regulator of protease activity HflC (stomatin/prohibitin superfamily)
MGCVFVGESSVRALERFGKFEQILEPGLHFYNPLVRSVRDPLSFRLQTIDYKVDTITSESLSVLIHVGLQFRIDNTEPRELYSVVVDQCEEDGATKRPVMDRASKLYQAYYGVADPLHQMRQHIMGYFRAFAAQHTLKDLLLEQRTMSGNLVAKLNDEMNRFGYIITDCVVTDIDPPDEIKRTMNSVLSSQNRRQAMINEAEGKKAAAILEAEGLCQVKKLEGEGMSLQRQALADGLKETVEKFGCHGQDMELSALTGIILTTQYIDMLNHAAQNGSNNFILSSNPLGAVSIDEQLKSSFLATQQQQRRTAV